MALVLDCRSVAYAKLMLAHKELRVTQQDESAFFRDDESSKRVLAYSGLQAKWAEDRWDWSNMFGQKIFPIPHALAHDLCYMACMKACRERRVDVHIGLGETEYRQSDKTLYVDERELHDIALKAMYDVMELPRT